MKLTGLKRIIWKMVYILSDYRSETPVFIVGCGHSGTTLILRILSESDEVYSIDYESNVFRDNWVDNRKIWSWVKRRRKLQKKFFIEKTPNHVTHLDKIFYIFPRAKIIVLLRDGRDVVLSLEKRTGDLKSSIERWVSDNESWLDNYKNDKRLKCVKLEDFTQNPNEVLKSLCDHINITYDESLLDYSKKEYRYQNTGIAKTDGSDETHQLNRNWQVNQPIFKDTNRWKKEMDDEKMKVLLVEERFITLMKDFGYIKCTSSDLI